MQHETRKGGGLAAVTAAAASMAAERDRDGGFPAEALAGLARLGLIAHPPIAGGEAESLLWLLAAIGRGDLNVGRIYEGHANALFLVRLFGSPEQRDACDGHAAEGRIFGVWNTDLPGSPLTLEDGRLSGAKSFATGVDGLSHALVTVERHEGRIMLMVPLDHVDVDRSWWKPLGMRASGSHVARFDGIEVDPGWIVGRPGDYLREPWFSAGAMRFAAVHVGGAHAVLDEAAAHLGRTGRSEDPYQRHRLGRMGIAVESGYAWLPRAAAAWTAASAEGAPEEAGTRAIAVANATRMAVESFAMSVLEEAERAVGAAGMIAPHPLERLIRDLRTYLRQPNPDGALAALGRAVAAGDWTPGSRG